MSTINALRTECRFTDTEDGSAAVSKVDDRRSKEIAAAEATLRSFDPQQIHTTLANGVSGMCGAHQATEMSTKIRKAGGWERMNEITCAVSVLTDAYHDRLINKLPAVLRAASAPRFECPPE